eukprot:TRINITY_DN48493_c0_g1_i1.p1 TRINITY_DN48493_c0_g1~~TRINITY_DN48493_c0_g1_i1.p1  ORF type:complete len:573 (+),score=74.51 TRINITY_DN48493_c0_g1_i1:86-1804(+)
MFAKAMAHVSPTFSSLSGVRWLLARQFCTRRYSECSYQCGMKQKRFSHCFARRNHVRHRFGGFSLRWYYFSAFVACASAGVDKEVGVEVLRSNSVDWWRTLLAPAPGFRQRAWPRCASAEQRARACDHDSHVGRLQPDELDCVLQCASSEPALELVVREYWLSEGLPGARQAALNFCDSPSNGFNVLYSIRGGRLAFARPCGSYYDEGNLHQMFTLLRDLADAVWFEDVDIVLTFGDLPPTELQRLSGAARMIPVGTMTRSESLMTVPWVNPYFLDWTFAGTEPARVAWHLRERKAFFVGTLSLGVGSHPEIWTPFAVSMYPRVRLLRIAASRPDLFRVRITGLDDEDLNVLDPDTIAALRAAFKSSDMVNVDMTEDFDEVAPGFRYVLNVPGVVASWNTLRVLRTGSVMILVRHHTEEHVLPLMEPWKHYVPVAADLSDLVSVVELLRADDELARSIGEAGQRLAIERMAEEDTYCYLYRAISVIRNITGSPIPHKKGKGNRITTPRRKLGDATGNNGALGGYVPLKTRIARGQVRGCLQQNASRANVGQPKSQGIYETQPQEEIGRHLEM